MVNTSVFTQTSIVDNSRTCNAKYEIISEQARSGFVDNSQPLERMAKENFEQFGDFQRGLNHGLCFEQGDCCFNGVDISRQTAATLFKQIEQLPPLFNDMDEPLESANDLTLERDLFFYQEHPSSTYYPDPKFLDQQLSMHNFACRELMDNKVFLSVSLSYETRLTSLNLVRHCKTCAEARLLRTLPTCKHYDGVQNVFLGGAPSFHGAVPVEDDSFYYILDKKVICRVSRSCDFDVELILEAFVAPLQNDMFSQKEVLSSLLRMEEHAQEARKKVSEGVDIVIGATKRVEATIPKSIERMEAKVTETCEALNPLAQFTSMYQSFLNILPGATHMDKGINCATILTGMAVSALVLTKTYQYLVKEQELKRKFFSTAEHLRETVIEECKALYAKRRTFKLACVAAVLALSMFAPQFRVFANMLIKAIKGALVTQKELPDVELYTDDSGDSGTEYGLDGDPFWIADRKHDITRDTILLNDAFEKPSENTFACFCAVSLAFKSYLVDPEKFNEMSALKDALARVSAIKTIAAAMEWLFTKIPTEYRLDVHRAMGFGAPGDATQRDRNLLDECHRAVNFHKSRVERTPAFRANYIKLHRELTERVAEWTVKLSSRHFLPIFGSDVLKRMTQGLESVNRIPKDPVARLAPFAMYLFGDSGVGKSFFINAWMNLFFGHLPPHEILYTKNQADQFNEGYCGQHVYAIDDLGVCTDVMKTNNTFVELLSMTSTQTHLLKMAFDKGMHFTSNTIIITSNTSLEGNVNAVNLTNGNAVLRRFDNPYGCIVEMRIKEEFKLAGTEGKLSVADRNKVDAQTEAQKAVFNHCDFWLSGGINKTRVKTDFEGVCRAYAVGRIRLAKAYVEDCARAGEEKIIPYPHLVNMVRTLDEPSDFVLQNDGPRSIASIFSQVMGELRSFLLYSATMVAAAWRGESQSLFNDMDKKEIAPPKSKDRYTLLSQALSAVVGSKEKERKTFKRDPLSEAKRAYYKSAEGVEYFKNRQTKFADMPWTRLESGYVKGNFLQRPKAISQRKWRDQNATNFARVMQDWSAFEAECEFFNVDDCVYKEEALGIERKEEESPFLKFEASPESQAQFCASLESLKMSRAYLECKTRYDADLTNGTNKYVWGEEYLHISLKCNTQEEVLNHYSHFFKVNTMEPAERVMFVSTTPEGVMFRFGLMNSQPEHVDYKNQESEHPSNALERVKGMFKEASNTYSSWFDKQMKAWPAYADSKTGLLEFAKGMAVLATIGGAAWLLYDTLAEEFAGVNHSEYPEWLRAGKGHKGKERTKGGRKSKQERQRERDMRDFEHHYSYNHAEEVSSEDEEPEVSPIMVSLTRKMQHNQARLHVISHGGTMVERKNCRAWFLATNKLLLLRHYVLIGDEEIDGGGDLLVKLTVLNREFEHTFSWKDVVSIKNKNGTPTDFLVWTLPSATNRMCPPMTSIMKNFVREDLVPSQLGGVESQRKIYYADASNVKLAEERFTKTYIDPKSQRFGQGHTQVTSDAAYRSANRSMPGDCALLITDGSTIYGLHMLGTRDVFTPVSYAQILTYEALHKAVSELDNHAPIFFDTVYGQNPYFHAKLNPRFESDIVTGEAWIPMGTTYKPAINGATSKLKRTRLTSELPSSNTKIPAPMSKIHVNCPQHMRDDPRSFQSQLLAKYENYQDDYPIEIYKRVVTDEVARINPVYVDGAVVRPRVWTVDEAINPISHCDFVQPIPRSTSAGFGRGSPKCRGKMHLLGYHDDTMDYYFTEIEGEELKESVLIDLDMMAEGFIPALLNKSFVKDETLTEHKVSKVGAREITSCQIDFIIIWRVLCGAYNNAFVGGGVESGHALGCAIFNGGWDRIIKHISTVGTRGFDRDVSNHDRTIGAQFIFLWMDAIDDWYRNNGDWEPKHRTQRRCLAHLIAHDLVVVGQVVMLSMAGFASGLPCTSLVVTQKARADTCFAYVILEQEIRDAKKYGPCVSAEMRRKHELTNLAALGDPYAATLRGIEGYKQNVSVVGLGDDQIIGVSERASFFTQEAYARVLKRYNVIVTNAVKDQPLFEVNRPVTQLNFLACTTAPQDRKSRLLPGIEFYPWIDDAPLAKCLSYVRPDATNPEITCVQVNIVNVLSLVWSSGRVRFDRIRAQLVADYMNNYRDYTFTLPTFDAIHESQVAGLKVIVTELYNDMMAESKEERVANANSGVSELITMKVCDASYTARPEPIVETPQTLMTIMRRYYKVHTFLPPSTNSPLIWVSGSQFSLSPTTGTTGVPVLQNPLAQMAAPFRMWSGSTLLQVWSDYASLGRVVMLSYSAGPNTTQDWLQFQQVAPARGEGVPFLGIKARIDYESMVLPFTTKYEGMWIDNPNASKDQTFPGVVFGNRTQAQVPLNLYVSVGDNFHIGLPYCIPSTKILVNLSPDNYPDVVLRNDGIGMSKTVYNIDKVVDSSISSGQTIDGKLDLAGLDCPNVAVRTGGLVQSGFPSTTTATCVNYAAPMGLTYGLEDAQTSGQGGMDELSFQRFGRMTWLGAFKVSTTSVQGDALYVIPLVPNHQMVGRAVGSVIQTTSVGYLSNFFKFWRGTLRYGFQFVLSGVVTARIAIAILYDQHVVPTNLENVLGQGYVTCDVNASSQNFVVDVPYVSPTTLKEVYNGQADRSDYSMGLLVVVLLNNYKAPASASPTMDCEIFQSVGADFDLRVPFCTNNSLTVQLPSYDEGKASLFNDMDTPSTNLRAPVGEEKVGAIMVETAPLLSHVTGVRPNTGYSMLAQPTLTFDDFIMRPQLLATTDWAVTDVMGTTLFAKDLPFGVLQNTSQRAMDAFRLSQVDIAITVKVNGTVFHAGRMCLSIVPGATAIQAELTHSSNKTNMTWVPHVFIDAAVSGSSTIVVPYRNIQPLMRNVELKHFASALLSVFTPLTVGTGGQPAIQLSIFVAFQRPHLRVMNPTSFV